jgi:hypothetical protein
MQANRLEAGKRKRRKPTRCAVYRYDDLDRYALTDDDSGSGASPKSEVAVFCTSAVVVTECWGSEIEAQQSGAKAE